jgi:hypothetical protein
MSERSLVQLGTAWYSLVKTPGLAEAASDKDA